MTKQKLNGRFIVTKTAEDFTMGIMDASEVDFRDMKATEEESAKKLREEKMNFDIQFFPAEKKIILSWDLAN
jgi:hypothetical protein